MENHTKDSAAFL